MKKIRNLEIPFEVEVIERNITYHKIIVDLKGKDNSLLSYKIKELLTLLIVFIVPLIYLIAMNNYDTENIQSEYKYKFILVNAIFLALVIISVLCYIFLRFTCRHQYLNKFRSQLIIVSLLEISAISYASLFVFIPFSHLNSVTFIAVFLSYVAISLVFVKQILEVKIKEELNKNYGLNLKIGKISYYLSKYPTVVLGVIIFAMIFYRTTKSAFIVTNNNNPVAFVYNIVGNIGFLLIAFSISLLPTILFEGSVFVRGVLLKKYSEQFRKEYDFTKEEWYGE